jgi:hypothetical protein
MEQSQELEFFIGLRRIVLAPFLRVRFLRFLNAHRSPLAFTKRWTDNAVVLGTARESIAFVVEQASRLFPQPPRPLFCSKDYLFQPTSELQHLTD